MKKYSVCLLILISVSLYSCCKKQVIDDILYGTITKLTTHGSALTKKGEFFLCVKLKKQPTTRKTHLFSENLTT
jgi:hypothetical protein